MPCGQGCSASVAPDFLAHLHESFILSIPPSPSNSAAMADILKNVLGGGKPAEAGSKGSSGE